MSRLFFAALGLAGLLATSAVADGDRITFTKDVAPIFYAKCADCHRPGEIAPFSLLDYESARAWAKSIRKAVHDKTMPPWHADSSKVEYANDRSLSEGEIATIVEWVNQGAARGNAKNLPDAPEFHDTWAMGEPDFVFHGERDFEIPANEDKIDYQGINLTPSVEEDLYIVGWEIRPAVRKAVHHANLVRAPQRMDDVGIGEAVSAGGDYIGSYLPGARPMTYPEGTALRIPKGSHIGIQVHYVGLEEPVTDHIMFGVKFAQGRVDKIVRTVGTDDWEITIAPGDPDWVMNTEVKVLFPVTIFSSGAHMHLRGDSYTAKAILPDGDEKLITHVPNYDFNWQSNYVLANPIEVPAGTRYHIEAHWNNSDSNPLNPDPTQKVTYGKWTENEMLTTWSHVVLTNEKLGLKVENGRVVGRFDDAGDAEHPALLQTLPATFTRALNRRAAENKPTD